MNERAPGIVALGGGHGLSVTLAALLGLTDQVTGIVGVIDDGGSSGRLRSSLSIMPPGDLRMALAAMLPHDAEGELWRRVLQYRFTSNDELAGHALGNLMLAALWSESDDAMLGLDALHKATRARGRVLPNALQPVDLLALMRSREKAEPQWVTGQATISSTHGHINALALDPADPKACPQAVEAIESASALVLGPGSWFTSVLPHLFVPSIRQAIDKSAAIRILILNLNGETGETQDFAPETHLRSWHAMLGDLGIDHVIADGAHVLDRQALQDAAHGVGAQLHVSQVASGDTHDPRLLGAVIARLVGVPDRPCLDEPGVVQG